MRHSTRRSTSVVPEFTESPPLGLTPSDAGKVTPADDDVPVEVAFEEAPRLPPFDSAPDEDPVPERRLRAVSNVGSASCWICLHAIRSSTTVPPARV